MTRHVLLLVAFLGLSSGCGGDDDRGPSDASLGADSSEILPDAGMTTTCGLEPDTQTCDRTTEICVGRDLGGAVLYDCVPLPGGCDVDRTCVVCSDVCEAPADTCIEGEADNTLTCACLECA